MFEKKFIGLLYNSLLLVALMLSTCVSLHAQTSMETIKAALKDHGFSNIRAVSEDSVTILAIQNDAYKLQASGIAAAIRTLEDEGILDGGTVRMLILDCDVPQLTLTYDSRRGDWDVSHHVERSDWKSVRRDSKTNSSFGKIDLVVYPQISLMNLIITQVYQSLWQLNPAIEMTLWPGSKISYQVKIPVWNDGYGNREDKIHPGMITLSQRFRLPFDITGKAVAGVFYNNRYGLGIEMQKRFSFAPWLMLEGGFRMLGLSYFDSFVFHRSKDMERFWNLGVNLYWPEVNTEFKVKAEKFLLADVGAKAEMIRHFRYCSIGFYVEKGFNSYAKTNGGFRFQIALPPYRFKRAGYWPRVTTSGQMGMVYNANNEQRWYKETKLESSDNIMNSNAFNPYYIKSEIKSLNRQWQKTGNKERRKRLKASIDDSNKMIDEKIEDKQYN